MDESLDTASYHYADPGIVWPSPRTFFGAPSCADIDQLVAQVALLGIPFDGGTTYRTGQGVGPASARSASVIQLDAAWPGTGDHGATSGWFDIESGKDHLRGVTMADCGDVPIVPADIEGNFQRITRAVERIVQRGSLVVAVGGDHAISFPVGRGMRAHGKIDVVHFDAHADFAEAFFGSRYTHGTNLRRLSELDFVSSIAAIGLRNVWRDEFDDLVGYGARYATSKDILERGATAVVEEVVPRSENIYVSIDIDVLDLPLVPGTTLPEPGGLPYRALREALAAVATRGRVVGFDIVELNPPYDAAQATARITTWLIVHFLSSIFDSPSVAET
ncbi:MAG: arginase family protein [Acidimicrobiales bacterium]